MLLDIQPGNTKILYFFNCLLDGMHTINHPAFVCPQQKNLRCSIIDSTTQVFYKKFEYYSVKNPVY